MNPWRKLILFTFIVLLPAVVVGISNLYVFPDSALAATIMLLVTVGVAGIFTWQSGAATARVARYCVVADLLICVVLCVNLGCHWLLAREVSAARQGVAERHTEEDREDRRELARKNAEAERELALKKADADLAAANAKLAEAERRRLLQLPVEQRRSVLSVQQAPKEAATPAPAIAPLTTSATPEIKAAATPKLTPEQVREKWWAWLTALAFAECFTSVLAGAILCGVWEWDRNRDGIPDHLQHGAAWPRSIDVGK